MDSAAIGGNSFCVPSAAAVAARLSPDDQWFHRSLKATSRVQGIRDQLMTTHLMACLPASKKTPKGKGAGKSNKPAKPAKKKTPEERKRYRDKNKKKINLNKKKMRWAKKQEQAKRFKLAHLHDDIRNFLIPGDGAFGDQ